MTTISVVLPTYNRAHTLPRALASVFGQTRPPEEVIVVDDGSTDTTAAVVAAHPRARLLHQPQNGGAARARNAGVRAASGDWIAFIDSDDIWLTHRLERQLRQLESAPETSLLIAGIVVHEVGGAVHYHCTPAPPNGWTYSEVLTYPFSPSTWLVRREALLDVGLFDETMRNCEDLEILGRMLRRLAIGSVCEPLVIKYNQSDSLDARVDRTAASFAVLFERHRDLWQLAPVAAAASWRRLATMHMRADQLNASRTALRKSLAYRPLALQSWALLAASLLGKRAFLRLSRALAVPA